jgi:phenylalanyl-tRNA synthetase beta chain
MQISLKWVNELVDIEIVGLEELIEKLTLGGFEVEEIIDLEIEKEKRIALQISTTPNRSDSLSIQGISLEIAALLNKKPKISNYTTKMFNWETSLLDFKKSNLTKNNCSDFVALTIENLTDFRSPKWLKQKLSASGLLPEDTFVDFQNYILLETGYPIEFYNLNQIYKTVNRSEFDLQLISGTNNKEFLASNQTTYQLDTSILILTAGDLPISIAGIIPNQNYAYSKDTKSLLIEGSIFNAAKIRQQSRRLSLRTNRSSRYEKSINNRTLFASLYRLVCLLRVANPQLTCQLHTKSQGAQQKTKIINLNYQTTIRLLGPIKNTNTTIEEYLSPSVITKSLERLQFKILTNEEGTRWRVEIPDSRTNDIEREIDLIEEIGRLYGFNNFLTRLPNLNRIGTEDFAYQLRKKVTSSLLNAGFNELIQYSLVPSQTYLINEIKLINPLVKDYSNLRSSLLPNLLKAVEENIKKSTLTLEGFEYGHVFSESTFGTIHEEEHLAGIFGGTKMKSNWSNLSQSVGWFEGKSKLDDLFKKLNLITYWESYKPIKEKDILHPYRTAGIYFSDHWKVGLFGQIHPLLAKKLNISRDIYLFELNFEAIKEQAQKNKLISFQEYSLYPKIVKDLSFIIPTRISFQEVKKSLYLNGSKVLKEINLLDEYRGTSIPVNYTSVCIQFVFHSDNETLTNKKIEIILNTLKLLLMDKFDAELRV